MTTNQKIIMDRFLRHLDGLWMQLRQEMVDQVTDEELDVMELEYLVAAYIDLLRRDGSKFIEQLEVSEYQKVPFNK